MFDSLIDDFFWMLFCESFNDSSSSFLVKRKLSCWVFKPMSINTLLQIESNFSLSKHLLIQFLNVEHIHRNRISRIRLHNLKRNLEYNILILNSLTRHLLPGINNSQPGVLLCFSYLFSLFVNMDFISWRKSSDEVKVKLGISFRCDVYWLEKSLILWDSDKLLKLLLWEERSELRLPKF